MYVRMVTYHLKPGVERSEATSVYGDTLDILRTQEGFQGSALLLDEDVHTAISLTYWSNAECAEVAGETLLPALFDRTADLLDRPPDVSGYDLLDQQFVSD